MEVLADITAQTDIHMFASMHMLLPRNADMAWACGQGHEVSSIKHCAQIHVRQSALLVDACTFAGHTVSIHRCCAAFQHQLLLHQKRPEVQGSLEQ